MSGAALDVVVVPDFAGSGRRIFEACTLLFLGSWLEHRGASRDWPLHMVCIGDPPAGVAALAERCGAQLSIRPELTLRGHCYHAIVGLAGCDKSLPGMMMAMVRLNTPSVFIYGGSILPGRLNGKDVTVQDVFEAVGKHQAGFLSPIP